MQSVGEVPGDEIDAPDGGVTLYRDGRYVRVATDEDLGPQVVESLRPVGVTYTASADDAVAAVDRGDAAAAFLLEPVTFQQVARFAHAPRDDAAEVDVLLSEADLGAALPPGTLAAWRPVTRSWPRSGT